MKMLDPLTKHILFIFMGEKLTQTLGQIKYLKETLNKWYYMLSFLEHLWFVTPIWYGNMLFIQLL